MTSLAHQIFDGWKRFAQALEQWVLVGVLGTLFYFLVVGPISLLVRISSQRIQRFQAGPTSQEEDSYWVRRDVEPPSSDHASRPF